MQRSGRFCTPRPHTYSIHTTIYTLWARFTSALLFPVLRAMFRICYTMGARLSPLSIMGFFNGPDKIAHRAAQCVLAFLMEPAMEAVMESRMQV